MDLIWWLLGAVLWITFLVITMSIARSKGHSALLWGLLAVFLPLITVIVVLLLPNRSLGERPVPGQDEDVRATAFGATPDSSRSRADLTERYASRTRLLGRDCGWLSERCWCATPVGDRRRRR